MVTYEKALMLGVAPILDDSGRIIAFPTGDVYIFDGCNNFFGDRMTAWETIYFTGDQALTTENTINKTYLRCNRGFIQNPKVLEQLDGKSDIIIEIDDIIIACKYDTKKLLELLLDLSRHSDFLNKTQSITLDLSKIGTTQDELYSSAITVINKLLMDLSARHTFRVYMMQLVLWLYQSTGDNRYKSVVQQIARKTYSARGNPAQIKNKERTLISKINKEMNINIPGGKSEHENLFSSPW